jgi:hypothetical protein
LLLNLANNNIGQLVPPAGWKSAREYGTFGDNGYISPSGRWQAKAQVGGAIALANAIPDMGAISTVTVNTFPLPIQDIKSKTKLDFSNKGLEVEDAIIIAALLPLNVSRTISTYIPILVIADISCV